MNINNKSLGLISSVFAITMASTNPAGACEWLSRLCCGGDDEADSETTRLNIQSNQPPSALTIGENSLTQQSIASISMQTNHLTLKVEERQRLLQERKEKLEEERLKIALEEQLINELENIKATTKTEEVKISAEEFDLQQKQAKLEERKAALMQTPVKPKNPSRFETPTPNEELTDSSLITSTPTPYPGEETEESTVASKTLPEEKIETSTPLMSSSLTPTETLSSIQQQIIHEGKRDKVGKRLWNCLQNDDNLAKKLNQVRTNSYLDSLIEIQSITHNSFKLTVNGKPIVTTYYY